MVADSLQVLPAARDELLLRVLDFPGGGSLPREAAGDDDGGAVVLGLVGILAAVLDVDSYFGSSGM
jgi:hypothetical protein